MSSENNSRKGKNTDSRPNPEVTEILGEDLVEILRLASPPSSPEEESPDWVRKNVQASYQRDFRYRILWRKVRINIQDFISFVSSNVRLTAVVLTGIVLLFVVGASVYYQYQSANYINPDLTSKKQTPVVNIEPTPTPVPSAGVAPIATPGIVEEPATVLQKEENMIAYNPKNNRPKGKGYLAESFVRELGVESNTNTSSKEVTLYIGDLTDLEQSSDTEENKEWMLEFCNELKTKMKEAYNWNTEEHKERAGDTNAGFKLDKDKYLVLKVRVPKQEKLKTVWISNFKLVPESGTAKDLASKISNELGKKFKAAPKSNITDTVDSSEKEKIKK